MIAQPLVYVFVKVAHRQRFKNKKVLKEADRHRHGYYAEYNKKRKE